MGKHSVENYLPVFHKAKGRDKLVAMVAELRPELTESQQYVLASIVWYQRSMRGSWWGVGRPYSYVEIVRTHDKSVPWYAHIPIDPKELNSFKPETINKYSAILLG